MKQKHRSSTLGTVAVLAAAFLWGTIPLIIDYTDGAPLVKVFYRVLFAALGFTAWLFFSHRWRVVKRTVTPRVMRLIIAQGVMLTINWSLFLGAFEYTDVAVVEMLGYTGPLLLAIVAPFFLKNERRDKRIFMPILSALAGLALMLLPQVESLSLSPQRLTGLLMAAESAITYVVLTVQSKKILDRHVPVDVALWYEYSIASILLLGPTLYYYSQGRGPTGIGSYLALAVLGLVCTAIAGWLFFSGLRRLRVDRAAMFTYAEPVIAVILAALFLHQHITWTTLLGGALVIVGGTFVARMDATESGSVPSLESPNMTADNEPLIDSNPLNDED